MLVGMLVCHDAGVSVAGAVAVTALAPRLQAGQLRWSAQLPLVLCLRAVCDAVGAALARPLRCLRSSPVEGIRRIDAVSRSWCVSILRCRDVPLSLPRCHLCCPCAVPLSMDAEHWFVTLTTAQLLWMAPFGGLLVAQHVRLIARNLTTNEAINYSKYGAQCRVCPRSRRPSLQGVCLQVRVPTGSGDGKVPQPVQQGVAVERAHVSRVRVSVGAALSPRTWHPERGHSLFCRCSFSVLPHKSKSRRRPSSRRNFDSSRDEMV